MEKISRIQNYRSELSDMENEKSLCKSKKIKKNVRK